MRAIDKGNGARRQPHGMIGMKQSWMHAEWHSITQDLSGRRGFRQRQQ